MDNKPFFLPSVEEVKGYTVEQRHEMIIAIMQGQECEVYVTQLYLKRYLRALRKALKYSRMDMKRLRRKSFRTVRHEPTPQQAVAAE